MKRLTCERDYLCIVGKASEITTNLNKIGAMYDLSILSSTFKDNGVVMVILERRKRDEPCSSDHIESKLPGVR